MLDNNDLRSVSDYDNIKRVIFRNQGIIDLTHTKSSFNYDGFNRDFIYLTQENGCPTPVEYRRGVVIDFYENLPCKDKIPDKSFRSSFDEVIRNAEKHGNSFSKDKKIGIGYKNNKDSLEVIVEDEGGKLHPEFIFYIEEVRDKINEGLSFDGFYDFTREETPYGHSGSGIKTISYFYDDITFHKSDLGGLLVKMTKNF